MKYFLTLCTILLSMEVASAQEAFVQEGVASYYGHEFNGRRTSSGERYSKHKLTAAHPTLAFGTSVKVTNVDNGKSVVVKINDRGPSTKKRIIDVSFAAAKKLGMLSSGTANVRIESISITSTEPNDSTQEPRTEEPTKELFQLDVKEANIVGWIIQIGSYGEATNFIRLAENIKKTYNRPMLVELVTIGDKQVYRILIGPEKNEESAKALLMVVKKEYPDAFIAQLKR